MFKRLLAVAVVALMISGLNSCAKKQDETNLTQNLSIDVQQKIIKLGFSPENAFSIEGGYIVEGDIFLTDDDLNGINQGNGLHLNVGNAEQYRTTNLVTGLPRTIVVSTSGSNITTAFSQAINDAIGRYNAENLQLHFQRGGSSGGGDINIRIVNTGQYIASSGFPTSSGNPYFEVKYAKMYNNYSNGFMTTVLAHEIGHAIGFRHTDYANRSYSCGTGGNEGAGTVGAIYIPGTESTYADPTSWMLACLSATTNRPFNSNDKTALNYLY